MKFLALFRVTLRLYTTPISIQLLLSATEEQIVMTISRVFWSMQPFTSFIFGESLLYRVGWKVDLHFRSQTCVDNFDLGLQTMLLFRVTASKGTRELKKYIVS